jgi:hypothetical protein
LVYELSEILGRSDETFGGFAKLSDFDSSRLMKKYILTEIVSKKTQSNRLPASAEETETEQELQERAFTLIEEL